MRHIKRDEVLADGELLRHPHVVRQIEEARAESVINTTVRSLTDDPQACADAMQSLEVWRRRNGPLLAGPEAIRRRQQQQRAAVIGPRF